MSPMDAAFLYSEDGKSHNDIGMVLTFDGPAPTHAELVQAVADRLALLPRFRQKLRHLPFAAAMPVWVDDTSFDLGRHVIEHTPAHDHDPIGGAVSQVMSGLMDLSLPLWQIHLFPGLPGDRWLLVVRMHHAMVDGVSSTEIVHLLLSPKPEGEPPIPDAWSPEPEPSDARLLAAAASDAGKAAARMFGSMLHSATNPPPPQAPAPPADLRPLLTPGRPVSPTAINGPVQADRRWGMIEVGLDTITATRKTHGGTVNDILLAACTHGLSSFIAAQGQTVDNRVLRAMVPVSLRSPNNRTATATPGNEVGAMVVELPLGAIPPAERVSRINEQTKAFKQLKNAMPAQAINPGADLTSPLTLILGTRMAALAPVVVNTVITNVPGPQTPLYLAGRRMHRLAACVALWAPLRIAISAVSYDGVVTIGVVSDAATFPDVQPLLDAIGDGMTELAR
ncbi:MAG TPA: wax ester/triacylglycerol synthase family O-acyltransferase [Mycobacterium sp.]|nr:wax ester/triacylglycerol synthase family O-acyltransferase [Mycobacterium sp.]